MMEGCSKRTIGINVHFILFTDKNSPTILYYCILYSAQSPCEVLASSKIKNQS